ncbi:MAG: YbaB/EbfC family nucleoid-associated protein [Metamycoplasmataceae bacterium]
MNMNKILEQAKKMQVELQKQEEQLKAKIFETEKQGIIVKMNGARKVVSIEINEILIDPDDKEMLQDLLSIAINEVLEQIDKEYEKISPKAPQGFNF